MKNRMMQQMGNSTEEIRKMFFSLNGIFSQQMFIFGMCSVYFVKIIIETLGISILNYVVNLLCLFPVLVFIQKRCRDFNSKGTLFIITYTLLTIFTSAEHFVDDKNTLVLYEYARYVEAIMYAVIMLLFFIPSKKEKDETLCSPLLRYPLLYAVVCWVSAIGATFMMMF